MGISKPYVFIILVAVITGLFVWNYRGHEIEKIKAKYEKAELELKLEAARANTELNKFKLDFETNLRDRKDELQSDYEDQVASINKSVASLANFRLQDPNATRPSITPGTANTTDSGDGSYSSGGAVLSEQASQFLYSITGESDIYLGRLRACQSWALSVEREYNDYKVEVDELIDDLKGRGLIKD